MFIVTEAWIRAGYTSCDHLIDNSVLSSVIGRSFPSKAAAESAAEKMHHRDSDRRVRLAPLYIDGNAGDTDQ